MKNLFLNKITSQLRSRKSLAFWAAFHIAIFLALAICFLCGRRYSINTNLFDILPESSTMKSVGKADRILSNNTGRQFFVLVEAKDFENAKDAAEKLCQELLAEETPSRPRNEFGVTQASVQGDNLLFENISIGASEDDLNEIIEFCYRNRFSLLDKDTIEKLNSPDGPEEIAEAALEKAYSGFSMMPLEYIATDPFFLTEIALENIIANLSKSGTSMSLNDGVLSAEYEGKYYVMLRGTLTPLGASITNKKSGVKKIYECAQKVQSQNPDVEFIYSGVPFHSYKSSSSAQKEIAIISTISVIAIILLFLFIFRTALPILCSVGAISLSAVTALCTTLLVFGQIHILCFVFGTTLIGTCLDYSVHFFIRWKNACDNEDGTAIRKKLFKGLLLSCASTELCYLILLFAPFMLLKQIAIFSFVGILSSFLTVVLVYPNIKMQKKQSSLNDVISTEVEKSGLSQKDKRHPEFISGSIFLTSIKKMLILALRKQRREINFNYENDTKCRKRVQHDNFRIMLSILLIAVLVVVAICFRKNLRIENDIRSFYTMSGKILDDEILATKILNHGSSGWYFIVRGSSQEEVLAKEQLFCKKLDEEIVKGNLTSYTACTQYVPSIFQQAESYLACDSILPKERTSFFPDIYRDDMYEYELKNRWEGDLIKKQLADLGFNTEDTVFALSQIYSDYIYGAGASHLFVVPQSQDNPLPMFMQNALSSLWIGEVGGEWFSAIMPLHTKTAEVFKTLCEKEEDVFFVNKVSDIGFELDRLTRIMLVLLAVAFAILILALNFFYPPKTVLKIAIVPLVVMLAETAALAAFNIPIGFFSVTAIILVFGLGLDYIIYTVESGDNLNRLAIFISFITTELSFGLIAFSTFVPVHIFGLVVFVGLLAAWITQIILGTSHN